MHSLRNLMQWKHIENLPLCKVESQHTVPWLIGHIPHSAALSKHVTDRDLHIVSRVNAQIQFLYISI